MVTTIKLRMSNAFLVLGTRPVLIDTGSPGEGRQIETELARNGVALTDLAAIIHTHVHADHVGSTAALLRHVNTPTLYHAADEPAMQRGTNGPLQGIGLRGAVLVPIMSGRAFPQFAPTAFLTDGMRLEPYGIPGTIHHIPGHTAGSVALVLDTGEAIVGDLLMGGVLGGALLPNRPHYHYFAESIAQVHQSITHLLTFPVHTLFVGHGGPLSLNAVRQRWPGLKP